MTSTEITDAMKHHSPVRCDGISYQEIKEYVLWYDDKNQRRLSAVLLDRNGNCTVRVPAERVKLDKNGGKS